MSYTEDIHRALGLVGQEPAGRPGVVVVLPDNYEPGIRWEGITGASVNAAAGFRSEVAIVLRPSQELLAVELFGFVLATGTVSTGIEIVPADAITGFTDEARRNGDLLGGRPPIFVQTKNTAAATAAGDRIFVGVSPGTAANDPIYPQGRIIIRQDPLFRMNRVIVRPQADNVAIRVSFGYRALERRKL